MADSFFAEFSSRQCSCPLPQFVRIKWQTPKQHQKKSEVERSHVRYTSNFKSMVRLLRST